MSVKLIIYCFLLFNCWLLTKHITVHLKNTFYLSTDMHTSYIFTPWVIFFWRQLKLIICINIAFLSTYIYSVFQTRQNTMRLYYTPSMILLMNDRIISYIIRPMIFIPFIQLTLQCYKYNSHNFKFNDCKSMYTVEKLKISFFYNESFIIKKKKFTENILIQKKYFSPSHLT